MSIDKQTYDIDQAVWPKVTVNILAYNRKNEVRTTLTKITQELDYPRDQLEIIVVDNASTDGTGEMVVEEYPVVKLITNEHNVGVSGWNRGFKAGTGDFFLVLDDDCYIEGQSLKVAIQNAQTKQADLVSFRVVSSYLASFYFNDAFNTGLLAFWGCSALISRRAIQQLHGFDKNIFVWAHEVEFTMRLLDHGLRHLFLPEVIAVHMKKPEQQDQYTTFRFQTNMRNLAYIACKYMQPVDAVFGLISLVLRVLIAMRPYPTALMAVPKIIEGIRTGLAIRSPVQATISRTYRKNYNDYINPLPYLPTRYRHSKMYKLRPRYYPKGKAIIEFT